MTTTLRKGSSIPVRTALVGDACLERKRKSWVWPAYSNSVQMLTQLASPVWERWWAGLPQTEDWIASKLPCQAGCISTLQSEKLWSHLPSSNLKGTSKREGGDVKLCQLFKNRAGWGSREVFISPIESGSYSERWWDCSPHYLGRKEEKVGLKQIANWSFQDFADCNWQTCDFRHLCERCRTNYSSIFRRCKEKHYEFMDWSFIYGFW